MTPDEFRAELEEELRWRQEELVFFKNQLSNIESEIDADRYRKSLVLILYSHFEGYVKIALQTYIKYINSLSLQRKDVIPALAAAGMNREFLAYENLDRKCSVFKTELPDDTALHRFCRRVDFIQQMEEFQNSILHLMIRQSIRSRIYAMLYCRKIFISLEFQSICLWSIKRTLTTS